ncbi:MAG: HXXEE domain-containing protein [Candidatus Acidiferrum sp.]
MDWLSWAPLGAAMLHMFEEFVFPGGFMAWYRRYRDGGARVTVRFLVIINAALLVACLDIGFLRHRTAGVIYWLVIAAVLCSNGIWHAWASYKSRGYSPGVITGLLIYLPMTVFGYIQFLRAGKVSAGAAIVAGSVGGSYHLWSALYHRSTRG